MFNNVDNFRLTMVVLWLVKSMVVMNWSEWQHIYQYFTVTLDLCLLLPECPTSGNGSGRTQEYEGCNFERC